MLEYQHSSSTGLNNQVELVAANPNVVLTYEQRMSKFKASLDLNYKYWLFSKSLYCLVCCIYPKKPTVEYQIEKFIKQYCSLSVFGLFEDQTKSMSMLCVIQSLCPYSFVGIKIYDKNWLKKDFLQNHILTPLKANNPQYSGNEIEDSLVVQCCAFLTKRIRKLGIYIRILLIFLLFLDLYPTIFYFQFQKELDDFYQSLDYSYEPIMFLINALHLLEFILQFILNYSGIKNGRLNRLLSAYIIQYFSFTIRITLNALLIKQQQIMFDVFMLVVIMTMIAVLIPVILLYLQSLLIISGERLFSLTEENRKIEII